MYVANILLIIIAILTTMNKQKSILFSWVERKVTFEIYLLDIDIGIRIEKINYKHYLSLKECIGITFY